MPTTHPLLRLCLIAAAFGSSLAAGCVFYAEPTQCGPFAYEYRGGCYCEEGYTGEDPAGEGCWPVMTFRITDDCDDEGDVGWKLFSDDRDWTWPTGTAVYITPGFGLDGLESIVCEEGEWICFGGESESGLSYGVGLEFAETCSDCCFRCDSYEVDIGYLTCE